MVSSSDYVSQEQHVIFPRDIEERIARLEGIIGNHAKGIEADWEPCDEDIEELTALKEFRADVEGVTGKSFDEVTMVPEDHFTDYAGEYVEEVIGDLSLLYGFVDWEGFGDTQLKPNYATVDLGGDTVYVR